jgi:menaquinone-dependent protoporphyrinogen oxidase
MSSVLVVHASSMGGTREIAEAVSDELRLLGHSVTCGPAETAPGPDAFDAVLIGSAIYAGRWRREAVRYLRRHGAELAARSTYLFQSGPVGNTGGDTSRTRPPRTVARLCRTFGLAEPVTFAGRLDPAHAHTRLQRWMATSASAGDYRNWEIIRGWAHRIGVELLERTAPAASTTPQENGEPR